jgi:hypothetical protein
MDYIAKSAIQNTKQTYFCNSVCFLAYSWHATIFLSPWNNFIFFLLTSLVSRGPVFARSQRLKQKVWFEQDDPKENGLRRHILHLFFVFCIGAFSIFPSGCGTGGGETENSAGQAIIFPPVNPEGGPPAGNPDGTAPVPSEADLEDVSNPDHIIGVGTPESCGAESFIDAVAQGGTIVFDCGPDPITLTLPRPAKVFNDANPDIVIDGGGLVSLSGGGRIRILYMNTCDADQVWTTPHCQNQDHPRLTVQNITFVNGNSTGEIEYDGGGAIWVRGGRFKAVNCRFFNNVCSDTGPDVGGAAVRVFSQYEGLPVYIVNCTFGGAQGYGNVGSNGGAISSIGVSWTIINSLFSYNRAIGYGANPADPGTPGGGSGGAIYNDGNTMTLTVLGTQIEYNEVNEHGSAIFFVSNDHTGNIVIEDSVITNNVGGSWYPAYDGISMHSDTPISVTDSIIEYNSQE